MRNNPPDPRLTAIRVDAHFFDTDEPEERAAAEVIQSLAMPLELAIAMPFSVKAELDHPNTPREVQLRAMRLVYTLDTGMGEPSRLDVAKRIMRGNALSGRHDADAAHVYDAAVWQAGYFVTCDRRVHRKASEFAEAFPDLWIVRPTKLLELLRERLANDEVI